MPKVIVTLAAYNEAENIVPVIAAIRRQGYACIVVDDGSRDGTGRIAEEAGAVVVKHNINLGQGYAFLTGLKTAVRHPGCEIIVSMDADGQHRPEDIPLFVERMERGHADIVIGSRILGGQDVDNPFLRKLMLPYVTRAVSWLSGYRHLTDAMCGFRTFRASSVRRHLAVFDSMLEAQYIAVEMFMRFGKAGLRIEEVPVHIASRRHGFSTKGVLRYGTGILYAAIKTLIDPGPPKGTKHW